MSREKWKWNREEEKINRNDYESTWTRATAITAATVREKWWIWCVLYVVLLDRLWIQLSMKKCWVCYCIHIQGKSCVSSDSNENQFLPFDMYAWVGYSLRTHNTHTHTNSTVLSRPSRNEWKRRGKNMVDFNSSACHACSMPANEWNMLCGHIVHLRLSRYVCRRQSHIYFGVCNE